MRRIAFLLLFVACGKAPAAHEPPVVAPPPATASVQPVASVPPIAIASASPPPKRNLPKRIELGDVDRYSFGLAADRDHVYWVDYHGGGGVFRAKKDGSGRQPLAGEQPFTRDVAVDDRWVYFTSTAGLQRIPKDGKGAVETLEKKAGFASRMLIDEDRLILQYGQKILSLAR